MTTHRTLLMLLAVLNCAQSEDCVLNLEPRNDAWDKALHIRLRQEYDASDPPRNKTIPVRIFFNLMSAGLDEYNSVFTAQIWARFSWYDERLTWTPAEYGGLKNIVLRSYHIWKPRLQLLNSVYLYDIFDDEYNECSVNHNGKIICFLEANFESYCVAHSKNWPYDMQHCILNFGKDISEVVKFSYGMNGNADDDLRNFEYLSFYESEGPSSHAVNFEFLKSSHGLALSVVIPSAIVAVLTLISSFVDPTGFVRLGLLYFSLISHFVLLRAINQFLPKQGAETPVILIFVRDSTAITLTSILFAYVLRMMIKKEAVPSEWITCITRKVTMSFGKYFISPECLVNFESDEIEAKDKVWIMLTKMLNCIYVLIIAIVYVVLYKTYIPFPIPKALYESRFTKET